MSKKDRRYLRTEKLLVEAMLALIREKPFSDITIDDIVTRADVARKTFYAHHANKVDLLWHSLEVEFRQRTATLGTLDPHTLLLNGKPLSYPVFAHIADYAVLYRDIVHEDGNAVFVFRLWDYIALQSYVSHQPLRDVAPIITVEPMLTAQVLAGALLGAVRWWISTNMQATPEQMAYRFSQLVAPGVLQSLGLEE